MVTITEWKIDSLSTAYPDGVVSSIVRYQYDDSGRILQEETLTGKNAVVSRKETSYAADGSVSETVSYNAAGDSVGKSVCEYEAGLLRRESLYNPKGELQSTEEYSLDSAGNKIGWGVKTSTGESVSTSYTWLDGKIVGVLVVDSAGAVLKRYERSYDSTGLLVQESSFDASGASMGTVTYINEKGRLAREERRNLTGGLLSVLVYVNDANGNPVEERLLDRSGAVIEVKTLTWKSFSRTVPADTRKGVAK
jgi:antitoxin component YwqK of YwqJK toxin-antitoxin module